MTSDQKLVSDLAARIKELETNVGRIINVQEGMMTAIERLIKLS